MAFFGGSSVDLTSPGPIGSTTPNTGRFTTLTLAPSANTTPFTASGYSLTGTNAQSLFDLSGTWNTSGTPTAFKLNVTDTASNASSLLMDLQVGGSSVFKILKGNENTANAANGSGYFVPSGRATFIVLTGGSNNDAFFQATNANGSISLGMPSSLGVIRFNGNNMLEFRTASLTSIQNFCIGATDTILARDAANILAQRNSTNAQTFRIYNTFTDASNYERGFMRWATNVLEIGAEAAGTGTSRNVSFVQGGATRLTIGSTIDANVSINCGQFIYGFQALGGRSLSADPTTSNLSNGFYNVFKNTTTGVVKLWYNDGGTMKSVTLA